MDSPASPPTPSIAERRAAQLAAPRIEREVRTIAAMLRIYCRDHHSAAARGDSALCDECVQLQAYATKRLSLCPYGADKPTCVKCPIHCYGARQREAMREVMRYAGPRMTLRHPVLAIRHIADGRKPVPPDPRGRGAPPIDQQPPASGAGEGS